MKLKKPNFWDYKKPNLLSYFLLPLTLPFIINNFFLSFKHKIKKNKNIKCICIGNIYVGGTAKTPLTIKIHQILKKDRLNTAIIKKFYSNQVDEQKLLGRTAKLYCYNSRKEAINYAISDNVDIAIFDDGLQDLSINYDLTFACFNSSTWIGNGFLIPSGPLREKIKSIKKYDAIFLSGNSEDISEIKSFIRKLDSDISIFEAHYSPLNIEKFNNTEKYLIFSGIGNPNAFKKTLTINGLNIIKEIIFPDHYKYTSKDINKIKMLAKQLNVKIITTEKDYIKFDQDEANGIEFLEIDLIIKDEDKLLNFIKSKI